MNIRILVPLDGPACAEAVFPCAQEPEELMYGGGRRECKRPPIVYTKFHSWR